MPAAPVPPPPGPPACSSRDAQRAWEKLDGLRLDGCRWKVDWAVRKDFDFFGWKWTEGPSRSPSRSPSRPVEMTY